MINTNTRKRIITAIFLLLISFLMIVLNFISVYVLIVFWALAIIEFLKLSNKLNLKKELKYFFNIFFISYVSLFCYFFFLALNFVQLKILVFILLFGCVASDIGGFICGKILKGPRITKISPNKTYSGAIGSIVFTYSTISILIYLINNNHSYKIFIISLVTSVTCQIGDLFFSYLKRKAKIKDSGNILPGHGGILDRIDGILLAVPVGLISLIILS